VSEAKVLRDAIVQLEDEIGLRIDEIQSKLCAVIGHEFIPDHCGKPEHDYCAHCRARKESPDAAR
jgi:hypothetical protein